MRTEQRLPWWIRALVRVLVPNELREEVEGDLLEGHARIAASEGGAAGRRWMWRQIRSLRPIGLFRAVGAMRAVDTGGAPPATASGWGVDLAHARRALAGRQAMTGVMVATVALAVGSTTSVFSVVRGVLLTPLAYPESDRLVQLWQTRPEWADSPNGQLRAFAERFPLSMPTFQDWNDADLGFEALGAWAYEQLVLQEPSSATLIHGERVTSGVFRALTAEPVLGRSIQESDDRIGAPGVAVISHDLWRDRYGSRNDALGQVLHLEGQPYTIVGVLSADFRPLSDGTRIWVSLTDDAKAGDRDSQYLSVVGRLAPGTSIEGARERLSALQRRLSERHPEEQQGLGSRIAPLLDSVVGDVRSTLWFLLGAVGMVLLVACANIANILSVQSVSRRREVAVKAALGAGPARLIRGLLLETALVAGVGGLAGVGLAWLSMPALLRMIPPTVPRAEQIGIDAGVLLFGLAVTVGTTMLAGLVPALMAAGTRPNEALQGGNRGSTGSPAGSRLRGSLVVLEVAVAFALLVSAGLLGTSYLRLSTVERGFATESLLVVSVDPDPLVHPTVEDQDRFVEEVRRAFAAIPGVQVSATNQVPLSGSMSTTTYEVELTDRRLEQASLVIGVVLENYFEVMQIPLIQGRPFTAGDDLSSPLVAVVNHALAERMWPGQSPLGKRLRPEAADPWVTVVGVAGDVRHASLQRESEPTIYVPVRQNHRHPGQWVIRARGDVSDVIASTRAAVSAVSPTTPIRRAELIDTRIDRSMAVPRFRAIFIAGLAGMAGFLALLGIHGVVMFSVVQRTREIGVRMALGARVEQVTRDVVGGGLKLAGAGIALGVALTLVASRAVSGFIYDIRLTDPGLYLVVAVGVTLVSAMAAYWPARRASAIDPMRVLKSD